MILANSLNFAFDFLPCVKTAWRLAPGIPTKQVLVPDDQEPGQLHMYTNCS